MLLHKKININFRVWVIIVGNFISQFEYYLYWSFLTFISFFYFPDSTTQDNLFIISWSKMIFTYAKFFGSIIFGYLATKYLPYLLLQLTFFGIALSTVIFIINPGYCNIGILSTYFLIFGRTLQSIFQGGESSLSNMNIMDINRHNNSYDMLNKKLPYNLTTMFAISAAYFVFNFVHIFGEMSILLWRIMLVILLFLMLGVSLIRRKKFFLFNNTESFNRVYCKNKVFNRKYISIFLLNLVLQSLPYSIYNFTFFFLDYFVVNYNSNEITVERILFGNSYLLLIDVCIIVLVTKLVTIFRINLRKLIIAFMLLIIFIVIPLFRFLLILDLTYINLIKLFFVFLGVSSSLLQDVYIYQIIKNIKQRYFIYHLTYSIGNKFVGGSVGVIMLTLWENFHTTDYLAYYFIMLSTLNLIMLTLKIGHKN